MANFFWKLAERMDWDGIPPKKLWRFILRKMDEAHGHKGLDYDY